MEKMKILFIGGNGNISWYCLKLALDAEHEVYALNRGVTLKSRREFPKEVIKLTGDIRNPNEIKELLKGKTFDVIADFICYDESHAKIAVELFENITRQYIFVSSVTVYQRKTEYLPFKENTPQWEETDYDYALEKVRAEKLFMDAFKNKGFPVTIVRPAHTYDTIIPVSLGHNCFTAPQRILNGKPALIAGDGTNLWTITHSKDFASAFLGLMGNEKAIGEDFHITTEEWLTWLEMTDILLDILGVEKKEYVHVPVNEILKMEVPTSKNMSVSYLGKAFKGQRMWCDIYDNSKIKSFVPGWSAKTSFREGMKETIDWMLESDVRRRFNPDLDNLLENLYEKYGEAQTKTRCCPVCKSKEKDFLSELCGNMSILGEVFSNCIGSNVCCKNCGCVYVDMDATQEDFNTYYNLTLHNSPDCADTFEEKSILSYYKSVQNIIKDYIIIDSQILDLGCGMGDFSKFLINSGYKNITGMGPNERDVKLVKEKGVNCIVADSFTKDPSLENKFDMIIISHVIEHFFDADVAFENIKTWLKPEGMIYIEVPDAARYCEASWLPYTFFTLEHIQHYTKDTLENIANAFGLELLKTGGLLRGEAYPSLYGLFKNNDKFNKVKYSDQTKIAISRYIVFCEQESKNFILPLEKSQEKLALWGIGTAGILFLARTFNNCNVVKLIDNNPYKQGLKFKVANNELPIEAPETLKDENITIVILAASFKNPILKQIRDLGFKNKVVVFKEE